MLAKLQGWAERFDALTVRERLLILGTVLVAVVLPVWMYVIEPAQLERASLKTKTARAESETALLVLELATLKAQRQADPNDALREEIARLQADLKRLDVEVGERAARLIPPREMLDLLERLLAARKGLRLVALEKGQPTPFQLPGADPAQAAPRLWRHDLRLVVEGGYFDFLDYLRALEALPGSFFWDGLEYRVTAWPEARIELKVHTLSSEAGWLGV